MQETRPQDLTTDRARELNKLRREYFAADSKKDIKALMDERLNQLPKERLVRRVKIGRNDLCPCNSGRKFKRCCISKVRQ